MVAGLDPKTRPAGEMVTCQARRMATSANHLVFKTSAAASILAGYTRRRAAGVTVQFHYEHRARIRPERGYDSHAGDR